jgi:hypothetical protein
VRLVVEVEAVRDELFEIDLGNLETAIAAGTSAGTAFAARPAAIARSAVARSAIAAAFWTRSAIRRTSSGTISRGPIARGTIPAGRAVLLRRPACLGGFGRLGSFGCFCFVCLFRHVFKPL